MWGSHHNRLERRERNGLQVIKIKNPITIDHRNKIKMDKRTGKRR
jgi:hypothetical protein